MFHVAVFVAIFILFVFVVVALASHFDLHDRIDQLEAKISGGAHAEVATVQADVAKVEAVVTPVAPVTPSV